MTMADVLEDIESLINQFAHAKGLGDLTRAQKIYEEILEKAKDAKIPLKANDPEKAVEELHRYVTGCRETQIELGLHVFGSSDRERAVEYAATAMAKDSHYSVSLRRVIAEYLGLDYDRFREKPFEINGLGMTNLETVEFLQKTALGVLQRLVEMGIRSEDLDSDVLERVLREVMDFELGAIQRKSRKSC